MNLVNQRIMDLLRLASSNAPASISIADTINWYRRFSHGRVLQNYAATVSVHVRGPPSTQVSQSRV